MRTLAHARERFWLQQTLPVESVRMRIAQPLSFVIAWEDRGTSCLRHTVNFASTRAQRFRERNRCVCVCVYARARAYTALSLLMPPRELDFCSDERVLLLESSSYRVFALFRTFGCRKTRRLLVPPPILASIYVFRRAVSYIRHSFY